MNFERTVILQSLVGSNNYYLNTKNSDKDYKVLTLPTFEDLYRGKTYSRQIITDLVDYDAHDVRKLPELFWKSNVNFLEILFSIDMQYEAKKYPELKELLGLRNEIATMNLPRLFSTCVGLFNSKFHQLEKGTEGTQNLVDLYGYDTKQFMHAFRILDFAVKFYNNNFKDFESAIRYTDNDRTMMLSLKNGNYNLEEAKLFLNKQLEETKKLENEFKSKEVDEKLKDKVEILIMKLVKNNL